MMTPKEIVEVVSAFDIGKEIEYRSLIGGDTSWYNAVTPSWDFFSIEYREKKKYIIIETWVHRFGSVANRVKGSKNSKYLKSHEDWTLIRTEEIKNGV